MASSVRSHRATAKLLRISCSAPQPGIKRDCLVFLAVDGEPVTCGTLQDINVILVEDWGRDWPVRFKQRICGGTPTLSMEAHVA